MNSQNPSLSQSRVSGWSISTFLPWVLRPGSVEWGLRRSEMQRVDYSPGEMGLCRRHEGKWVGIMDVQSLTLGISDAALKVACDGISGEVELRPQRKFADDRLRALAAAVNAERVGGFPSGRLFLDSAVHPSNFVADRSHHVN